MSKTAKQHSPALRLTVLLLLFSVACGSAGTGAISRQLAPEEFDGVMVDIINDNFYDARVYAVYGAGERHALGSVNGNNRVQGLTFPWRPRPLAFEIHLVVAFQTWVSYDIDVEQGEYLELRLPPNFSTSGSFARVARPIG